MMLKCLSAYAPFRSFHLMQTAALDGRKYNIAVSQIDIGKKHIDCLAAVSFEFLTYVMLVLHVGNAATDMGAKVSSGSPQADGSIKNEPTFDVKHVASSVVYMASLPLGVNVLSHTM